VCLGAHIFPAVDFCGHEFKIQHKNIWFCLLYLLNLSHLIIEVMLPLTQNYLLNCGNNNRENIKKIFSTPTHEIKRLDLACVIIPSSPNFAKGLLVTFLGNTTMQNRTRINVLLPLEYRIFYALLVFLNVRYLVFQVRFNRFDWTQQKCITVKVLFAILSE
jgi:hypothetical protein